MTDHQADGDPDAGPVRVVARLLRAWPNAALVVCFVVLAGVFGFMGVLDDWARAVLAVVFLAIAVTLVERWRRGDGA